MILGLYSSVLFKRKIFKDIQKYQDKFDKMEKVENDGEGDELSHKENQEEQDEESKHEMVSLSYWKEDLLTILEEKVDLIIVLKNTTKRLCNE
ncbi:unnamed protein product [Moneuplotes crassus]|uniref:Uncharacterized protein n=1 Tax=Euplotes crassus TaxID=5936 RepID=A0AAD2CZH4_EUPCR|nr:unnamed protein product [Moneuplotes crassus]